MKVATMMAALVAMMACVVGNAFVVPSGSPGTSSRSSNALAPAANQPTSSRSTGASAAGALNIKIVLSEEENIESALMRFRRTVSRSGHLQELRWKKNFETVAERKKRKRVQNLRKDKIQRSRDRKANEHKY